MRRQCKTTNENQGKNSKKERKVKTANEKKGFNFEPD